ncbi:MAG: FlgD immunoglobulin-like domain containing protein [candidate division Zixibacteria bacterium]|nr:FlgD immunoglobulin-like domain containing protein [candidate division Zixibacteria bacterium]
MKRNSLISRHRIRALVFFLSIFCLIGFNLALAQDPGIKDTCRVERLEKVRPNSQVVLNVYAFNDEALGALTIGIVFPDTVSNMDIALDSVSFVGTRAASATMKNDRNDTASYRVDSTHVVNKNRLLIWAVWFIGDLAPGSGLVAKVYFRTGPAWDSTQYVPVDSSFIPPSNEFEFTPVTGFAFAPVFWKGALEVKEINTPTKPTVFSLAQHLPNPFHPKNMIRFALPKDSWVKLEVYNILGQKVKTLVDEKLAAGVKEVEWDGRDGKGLEVASGIYFYRIKADDFSDVKKMVMLK